MRTLLFASILLAAVHAAAAPPSIGSLSVSSVPQGGRFEITGSSFGGQPRDDTSWVEIDGTRTATARWSDDRITAYVAEGIAAGTAGVRVVTAEGASAAMQLQIDPLPAPAGAVAWAFVADGRFAWTRPAVGADGTVYASDDDGFLYAVAPSGAPRWIRHLPSAGGHDDFWVGDANRGPIAVGPDGTIYVAVNLLGPDLQIQAWSPDGTLRWIHVDTEAIDLLAGPNIGPDGNLHFVTESNGSGGDLRVLDASGQVLLSRQSFYAQGQDDTWSGPACDLVFGPGDRVYFGSPVPRGGTLDRESLVALRGDGSLLWAADAGGQSSVTGQRDGCAAITSADNVYLVGARVGQSFGVHAFDPSGDRIWSFLPQDVNVMTEVAVGPEGEAFVVTNTRFLDASDDGGQQLWRRELFLDVRHGPVVHPAGGWVLAAGVGEQGAELVGVERQDGALAWRIELPMVEGVVPTPTERLRLDEAGRRAFVVARLVPNEPRWTLLAIDLPPGPGGTGGAGGGGGSAGAAGSGGVGGSAGAGGAAGAAGSAGGGGPDPAGGDAPPAGGCDASGGSAAAPALLVALLARRRPAPERRGGGSSRAKR